MGSTVSSLRVWAEMVKLSHSIFALPFALIATFLAGQDIEGRGWPYLGQLGLILVCMVSARSVAMTFNRLVDAEIDSRNPRTAIRPLPSGRLSRAAALTMLILSVVTFGLGCLGFSIFYSNTWPILLSGPVLVYLCFYSYCKRFTQWSHFVLGSAIAMSPVASWIAISPETVGVSAVLLAVAVTCWIGGFDVIYACQDIEVDRAEGLYSLPSRLGAGPALWVARGAHVVCVLALIALGATADLGIYYAIGVAVAGILLVVENSLVRSGDYRHVNLAFFTINGLVSVVLAAGAITDVFL